MSRALLEYVATWLLDHPDEMTVREAPDQRGGTVFEISVHPDDMGKIIGRGGRVIRSLRSLARAAAQREDRTCHVEVVD